MRSRYAAFTVGDEAYLLRSWHPSTRPDELRLDPGHRWVGLEVRDTQAGGPQDEQGVVTYAARSRRGSGPEHVLVERARFSRRAGHWVYVDGDVDDT